MNLQRLLLIFRALEDACIDYMVVGSLAESIHGRLVLTECLRISIAPDARNLENARRAILAAWPDAAVVDSCEAVEFRVLPLETPFFLEVHVQALSEAETVTHSGVQIRVARDRAEVAPRGDDWARPGFSLRQRLDPLHALCRELLPGRGPRGVRKYRSIEEANADRDRYEHERADRIRAARRPPKS